MANRWLAALADLLVGADCPGCGRPEPGLCGWCASLLRPEPHEVLLSGADLRVIAASRYAGTAERVVRRLKGPGHRHAAAWASASLAAAVTAHGLDGPVLVPVPATRRCAVAAEAGWCGTSPPAHCRRLAPSVSRPT